MEGAKRARADPAVSSVRSSAASRSVASSSLPSSSTSPPRSSLRSTTPTSRTSPSSPRSSSTVSIYFRSSVSLHRMSIISSIDRLSMSSNTLSHRLNSLFQPSSSSANIQCSPAPSSAWFGRVLTLSRLDAPCLVLPTPSPLLLEPFAATTHFKLELTFVSTRETSAKMRFWRCERCRKVVEKDWEV